MKKRLYSAAVILLFGIGISAQKTNSVKQEVKKDAKTVGKAVQNGPVKRLKKVMTPQKKV